MWESTACSLPLIEGAEIQRDGEVCANLKSFGAGKRYNVYYLSILGDSLGVHFLEDPRIAEHSLVIADVFLVADKAGLSGTSCQQLILQCVSA